MSLPHIHLLLNHFPIIGLLIALGLYVFALLTKSSDLKRASLVVFAGLALLAIPTYMSGNGAASKLKKLPDVSAAILTAHNDAAVIALVFMEFTGLFAWLALWQFRRWGHPRTWIIVIVLGLAVTTSYFMALTGNTGGEIRHTEIRSVPQIPMVNIAELSDFVNLQKWVWPTCETLHFVGLSLLLGVVFLIDLRMFGFAPNISFRTLHRLLPWATLGFGMNVLTGMLFFIGEPDQYMKSKVFQWKIAFVLLAGANALYFTMFDDVWALEKNQKAPFAAKFAAGSAAVLWIAIMWCGNMLPFLGDSF